MLIGRGKFELNISVPLVLEYEDVAKRLIREAILSEHNINAILDYLCKESKHRKVYYLWRSFLKDPKDDMILELAVTAGCDFIVTYNEKDFDGIDQFGIKVLNPGQFLRKIGELK